MFISHNSALIYLIKDDSDPIIVDSLTTTKKIFVNQSLTKALIFSIDQMIEI